MERKNSRLAQRPPAIPSTKSVSQEPSYYEYDTNGDGVIDMIECDSNGNGIGDMYIVDLNQDGIIDHAKIGSIWEW